MQNELNRKVKDIDLRKKMSLNELSQELEAGGGFVGKKVGTAVNILEKMVQDEDCINFLSFPACIVATGCRGVLRDIIKKDLVDAVITTCGTLDHDLARSWKNYYHGEFDLDDIELHKNEINRIGNVLAPDESYGLVLEKKIPPILKEIYGEKKEFSGRELIWEFGKRLNDDSIIYWAQKNNIPVFVPGLMDGAFGSQLWMFWQEHRDFKVNPIQDEEEIS
ncbi:MAG: deoxyhypusine synthase family protein, partial [Hadesarchaea archaeon]|nr:deoxyhypusine synthase family protein [Hadesarchaea archaeon]